MDNAIVKQIIEALIKKILGNKDLLSLFRSDPSTAVNKAAGEVDMKGIDLDDMMKDMVVESVKKEIVGDDGKLDIKDIGNLVGKAKDLLGGKKDDE